MKVYVAGSTRDIERVQMVQGWARSAGDTITFDWIGAEGEIRTEAGARIAQRKVQACVEADLLILLFPPNGGGLGCWIEMGAALASGADVWVVEPQRDSVFWQHPLVRRFSRIQDLCNVLAPIA